MSYKTPLAVYIVWHPDYKDGAAIAHFLYSLLCRDSGKPLIRSMGIPVYYRGENEIGKEQPLEISFNESEFTAVIALISDGFVIDDNYRNYLDGIFDACNTDKNKRRVYPVAISGGAFTMTAKLSTVNFIKVDKDAARYDGKVIQAIEAQIENPILHELCRLLMDMKRVNEEVETVAIAPPVRLFISHSKHDDSKLDALKFRDFINSQMQLKTFFDANDISYGSNFGDEIKKAASSSALVVFQSDSYSEREWCRIEVLKAKSAGCPIVIVNAIQNGERRAFPYLGNYPSIRLKDNFIEIVNLTLEQVLFNLYSGKFLASLIELYNVKTDRILTVTPELFNFIQLKESGISGNEKYGLVIYPDPPLGSEEMEVLNKFDDNFIFITPLTLPSISKGEITGSNTSSTSADNAGGESIVPNKKAVLSRKFILKDKTVGISISESDDMVQLGYGLAHYKDVMIEVARYVLTLGGKVAYGGDMRKDGFTELIFDLLAYYPADKNLPPNQRFYSYLAWPLSLKLLPDKQAELIQNVTFKKIAPPPDITIADTNTFLQPDSAENLYIWSRCLTKMREEMESKCHARVFIGGRTNGFKGKCPGILEELLIALKNNHPVYLVGALGGMTKGVIDALNNINTPVFSNEYYLDKPDYKTLFTLYNSKHPDDIIDYAKYFSTLRQIGFAGLSKFNGLTEIENRRLAVTPHISEIVYLILKGLTNCFVV